MFDWAFRVLYLVTITTTLNIKSSDTYTIIPCHFLTLSLFDYYLIYFELNRNEIWRKSVEFQYVMFLGLSHESLCLSVMIKMPPLLQYYSQSTLNSIVICSFLWLIFDSIFQTTNFCMRVQKSSTHCKSVRPNECSKMYFICDSNYQKAVAIKLQCNLNEL